MISFLLTFVMTFLLTLFMIFFWSRRILFVRVFSLCMPPQLFFWFPEIVNVFFFFFMCDNVIRMTLTLSTSLSQSWTAFCTYPTVKRDLKSFLFYLTSFPRCQCFFKRIRKMLKLLLIQF